MPIKGITKTKTQYAIEVDIEEFCSLIDREHDVFNDSVLLVQHLDAIPGVGQIMYNGHFGNYIYLMIDDELDNEATWKQIKEQITKALKEV